MKIVSIWIITGLALHLTGCTKSNNEDSQKDCISRNYGILKVSYGSNSVRHSILITSGSGTREKVSSIGVVTDTLQLVSGDYPVSISSINSSGASLDSKNTTVVITQCDESGISVPF